MVEPVSSRTTKVSLVARIVDPLDKGYGHEGEYEFTIDGKPVTPVWNKSRLCIFYDLTEGPHEVSVVGKRFNPPSQTAQVKYGTKETSFIVFQSGEEKKVPKAVPEVPIVPVAPPVVPETTLEGTVLDSNGQPIEGASVKIQKTDREEISNTEGRFLFSFDDMTDTTASVSLYINMDGYRIRKPTVEITANTKTKTEITLLNK